MLSACRAWLTGSKLRELTRVAAAAALIGAVVASATSRPAQAEILTIVLDQAKLVKLPDKVATLVIGNPLIADATLQPGGTMVLTGKAYGDTNLIALDRNGRTLMNATLRVQAPSNVVVVYRGLDRESYSCTPKCERRVMVGDADKSFTSIMSQVGAHNAQSKNAAQ